MDYDKISELSQGGHALNSKFYEEYIAPLVSKEPRADVYTFLLDHAHNARLLSISKKDIELVQFVERICQGLRQENEHNFIKLFSRVFAEQYDTGVKTESADRKLWEMKRGSNSASQVSALLELYKVYFENEFRLWSSIVYYFVCLRYKIKTKAMSLESFIDIGASEKFHAIKDIMVPFLGGNPAELTKGFDNKIRNGGAGHERWEILDNQNILLRIVEPSTGKQKEEIELTRKELEDYVGECRKSIWILKTGMFIFLINNPELERKFVLGKATKISEIGHDIKGFARDRSCTVKDFSLNLGRTQLKISIRYEGNNTPNEQIYFGDGSAYDVIYLEDDDWLHFHVLDIMQYVLLQLDRSCPPEVIYEIFDEDDQLLSHVEFDKEELKKIFTSDEKYEPIPKVGLLPRKHIKSYIPLRVLYGFVRWLGGNNIVKRADFKELLTKYAMSSIIE